MQHAQSLCRLSQVSALQRIIDIVFGILCAGILCRGFYITPQKIAQPVGCIFQTLHQTGIEHRGQNLVLLGLSEILKAAPLQLSLNGLEFPREADDSAEMQVGLERRNFLFAPVGKVSHLVLFFSAFGP